MKEKPYPFTGTKTPNIRWVVKAFDELTIYELYAIARLRAAVFVIEQTCFYEDLDGKDFKSIHILGYDDKTDELAIYSRIVPPGISFTEPSIGRVITAPTHRTTGLGYVLMEKSIAVAKALFPNQNLRIGAQAHLERFYSNLGFKTDSDVYDEDGIPHIEMVLQ
jgi:ElaA protein